MAWAVLMALAAPGIARPEESVLADRYGDPLPVGVAVRIGTVRYRGLSSPTFIDEDRNVVAIAGARAMTIRVEGRVFGVIGGDRMVVIDSATGKQVREFSTGRQRVVRLRLTPDQRIVVTHGYEFDDGLGLHRQWITRWDLASGKLLSKFSLDNKSDGQQFEITPDGSKIVAGAGNVREGTLRFLDIDTGEVTHSLALLSRSILALSPDGKTVVASSVRIGGAIEQSSLFFWRWTENENAEPIVIDHTVGALAFSGRGSLLAEGSISGKELIIYDVATRKVVRTLSNPDQRPTQVQALAFASNDQWLLARNNSGTVNSGIESQIHVWNMQSGRIQHEVTAGRASASESLAVSRDGTWLAASSGTRIKVWNLKTARAAGEEYIGHDSDLNAIRFTRDGQALVTSAYDGAVGVWDATTGKPRQFRQVGHPVAAVAADQGLFVFGSDGSVRVCEIVTGNEICRLPGYGPPARWAAAFSTDGKHLALWGDDYQLRIWDITTGMATSQRRVPDIEPPDRNQRAGRGARQNPADRVVSAVFSADAKRLALDVSPPPSIRVFDVESGRELAKMSSETLDRAATEFSHDGMRLATTTRGHPSVSGVMSFANGATAVVRLPGAKARESLAMVRDVASGDTLLQAALPEFAAGPVAFSPDARILAVAAGESNVTIQLLNVTTGEQLGLISGLPADPRRLCFSPDGKRLACGFRDGTALVWELKHPAASAAVK